MLQANEWRQGTGGVGAAANNVNDHQRNQVARAARRLS